MSKILIPLILLLSTITPKESSSSSFDFMSYQIPLTSKVLNLTQDEFQKQVYDYTRNHTH